MVPTIEVFVVLLIYQFLSSDHNFALPIVLLPSDSVMQSEAPDPPPIILYILLIVLILSWEISLDNHDQTFYLFSGL